MDYKRKIDFAIKLLRAIPKDGPVEISYSGGKDSDVILELAKMAGIDYRAIYKNTTIDPSGTIKHCQDMGAEILAPKQRFVDIIAERDFPNRWRRFCCSILKEYKVLDRAVQGIRREESFKRAEKYKEPEQCRLYPNKEKVRVYYPILEWTLGDVARFIEERGIRCAPVYYDEQGCFHPERRLGCLCCPLQSINRRMEEFKRYPGILKLYLRGGGVLEEQAFIFFGSQVRRRPLQAAFLPHLLRELREIQDRHHGRAVPGDSHRPEAVYGGLLRYRLDIKGEMIWNG